MIQLTKINGERFVIHADHIETLEGRPDTNLTLISGRRYVVRESTEDVIGLVLAWRRAAAGVPPFMAPDPRKSGIPV